MVFLGLFMFIRVLCVLLLLFCACSKPKQKPESNCLRISFCTEPSTIDPRRSSDFASSTLLCMIFEGLMRNEQNGPEKALAEKIDISGDGLTYTFHLRPSVWSDGAPVTAKNFEASWKAQINPINGSACAYLFYPIKNAEKAFKGQICCDDVGIKALDETTLQVTLERPTPYFLDLTSFPTYVPVPSHALAQFDRWKEGASEVISNGPFCIKNRTSHQQILLQKNDLFWAKERVHLAEIEIAILPNASLALKLFEKGDLDWIGGSLSPLPVDSLEMIRKKYSPSFDPRPATTFCTFNLQNPQLQNKNLRKALSLAINRFELVEKITQMGEMPATNIIPPALLQQSRDLFSAFDPEAARSHLEKALEEMHLSRKELQLSLLYATRSPDHCIAQAIQLQWKKILDLDIALKQGDAQLLKDSLQQRDYEICLSNWIAQFNDPINILERFTDPDQLKNYPGWKHPVFIELLNKSYLEKDPAQRIALFEKAEEIFVDEMPLTPLYHWSSASLWSERVHDKPKNLGGAILFEFCSFSPA